MNRLFVLRFQTSKIAAYEIRGRDVVLYWRGMAKGASITARFDAVAVFGGSYTGDASRAYVYYADEVKAWSAGMAVTVSPLSQ